MLSPPHRLSAKWTQLLGNAESGGADKKEFL